MQRILDRNTKYQEARNKEISEQSAQPRARPTRKIGLVRLFTASDCMRQIKKTVKKSHLTLWDLRATRVYRIILAIQRDFPELEEFHPDMYIKNQPLYTLEKLEVIQEFTKCLCELSQAEIKTQINSSFARILWGLYCRREGIRWEP